MRLFNALREVKLDEDRLLCYLALVYEEAPVDGQYEAAELLLKQDLMSLLDCQIVMAFAISTDQREIAGNKLFNHPEFRPDQEDFYKLFALN